MNNHPLANRIKKVHAHLQKWAKRQNITCYRIYERDLTDYPLILDWYDGDAIMWLYERQKDIADTQKEAYENEAINAVLFGLNISRAHLFLKERKKQKGLQQQYTKLAETKVIKNVKESGLQFEVNLSDYLDIGLFLDHRKTRQMVKEMAAKKAVLNLFAYTGSFTCYALAGGAVKTTTVDLNPNYSQWTKRNLVLNGFAENENNKIMTMDCRLFLKKKAFGDTFDIIICDPPTFSNTKRGQKATFSVDTEYVDLINQCFAILNWQGTIFFSTNSRKFKLDTTLLPKQLKIQEITFKTIPEDFKNKKIHKCWIMQKIYK
jgi:23S rRNA (cytosine1962-C5)-methyltransferase